MGHNSTNDPSGRLLAIGDIHGCVDQLRELLVKVAPCAEDQVVFLGDYIDRGADSAGVIEDLLAFRGKFPASVFLRGNHEEMFLDVLAGGDPSMFVLNGGDRTIMSYKANGLWPLPDEHRRFFEGLAYLYETDDFVFVHAGLRPGVSIHDQDKHDLLWIRQEFIGSDCSWGKTVVFGHTPLLEPFSTTERIGLDTGCVYGRVLTCCEVRTRQIWQA